MSLERYNPGEVEQRQDGEVLDGELVDEQPKVHPVRRIAPATVVRVVEHDRTRRAGKATARHSMTVLAGLASWARRGWDASTLGVYRRQIKAAEALGDREALADWTERREAAVERRHKRLMDLPKLAAGVARVALGSLAVLMLLVLLLGVFVQLSGAGEFVDVVVGVTSIAAGLAGILAALWTPLVAATPFAILAGAWREGRRRGQLPDWAMPVATTDDRKTVPTEGAVLDALRHLGITALDQAFKDGWASQGSPVRVWEQGAVRDGKGWRVQLILPKKVPVAEVAKRRETLAHNLVRLPVEVWPAEAAGKPGVLDLWVADQGVLSGAVDPWPLLSDGAGDYFAGVPVGVTLRGDQVTGELFEHNYVIAGMMGSGKSTLIITLLLGAMLDPLVELDVFVLADNADFEPMRPRLRQLVTGPGEDTVTACMATMRELYSELETRGQALRQHGNAPKVTRKLAERDARLRPRVMVVDECQSFFMQSDGAASKEAAELTKKLVDTARKYAITLVFATPTPSADTLPRAIVSVLSNRACFAIGDQTGNDAVLGTGSYKAGVSAVGLEPKTAESPGDIGTAMTRGFTAKPSLLRCMRVAKDEHQDQVTPVVERALALRQDAGVEHELVEADQPDLLADVAEALAGEDVRAPQVAARLRDRPGYPSGMTGSGLVVRLRDEHGITIRKKDGDPMVRAADVAEALAAREGNGDTDG